MRRSRAIMLTAVATAALTLTTVSPAQAALPTPISASTARSYLSSLDVRTEDRTG